MQLLRLSVSIRRLDLAGVMAQRQKLSTVFVHRYAQWSDARDHNMALGKDEVVGHHTNAIIARYLGRGFCRPMRQYCPSKNVLAEHTHRARSGKEMIITAPIAVARRSLRRLQLIAV
jgi:hypothetical protein